MLKYKIDEYSGKISGELPTFILNWLCYKPILKTENGWPQGICSYFRFRIYTHVTGSQSLIVQGKYLSMKYFVQLFVCMDVYMDVSFCLLCMYNMCCTFVYVCYPLLEWCIDMFYNCVIFCYIELFFLQVNNWINRVCNCGFSWSCYHVYCRTLLSIIWSDKMANLMPSKSQSSRSTLTSVARNLTSTVSQTSSWRSTANCCSWPVWKNWSITRSSWPPVLLVELKSFLKALRTQFSRYALLYFIPCFYLCAERLLFSPVYPCIVVNNGCLILWVSLIHLKLSYVLDMAKIILIRTFQVLKLWPFNFHDTCICVSYNYLKDSKFLNVHVCIQDN